MTQNLLEITIIGLLIYIGYLGKFYLPSYFKKKAENLAQSQDLENLTKLVKEVEFKFEERTQNLKAKLDLTNQLQLGLHNEERTSLITLHNKLLEYYNFLTDVTFGGIDFTDNIAINTHIIQRSLFADSLFIQKNNFMLFVNNDDEEIENIITKIILDFLKFGNDYLDYCNKLRKHNLKFTDKLTTSEINTFYDISGEINSEYRKTVERMIDNTGPKINDVTRAIKTYLNKRVK